MGDGGVGKSTLLSRFVTGFFEDDQKMTIGVDFLVKRLELYEMTIALQIWDFGGEDRFRFLLPRYVKGASGGIFMYDITRYSSLKNLNEWLKLFRNGCTFDGAPILIVGGKVDLKDQRSVDYNDAYEMAKSFNLSGYVECSSKTGENVENIFQSITSLMLEKIGFFNSNEFKQIEETTQEKSIFLFD